MGKWLRSLSWKLSFTVIFTALAFGVTACGGGGGGGGGSAASGQPSISSFTAGAAIITTGSSVSLTAVFANGTGVIDSGVGNVTSGSPVLVTPSITTTYTLTVTNAAGTFVTASVTVTVVPPPSITSFTTDAAIITAGSSVSLTAVFADGTGVIDNGTGSVTSGSPVSVTPAAITTYIYTLTVTNAAGTFVTSSVTVTVVPPPSITSFTTESATIPAGSSVNLTAVFANGTSVIDNGVGSVTSGSPISVTPATTTTYILTVTNAAGTSVTASVTVTVVRLDSLSVTGAVLDQIFQSAQADYTAMVGFLARSVRLTATTPTAAATITVNGITIGTDNNSQLIALTEGLNPAITIVVTASSITKTYTLTLTRQTAATFAQQAYAKASNTDAGDNFGYRVAVSGDTLAVGAYTEDSNATGIDGDQTDNSATDSGAVYVFTRSGITWSQQAYIKASNTDANDNFGFSVALSGDTLAVGAFKEDSNATGVNGNQSDNSAIYAGAVYIFTRNGTTWSQQAYIKASNTEISDGFGASVALSGDTLAVGAIQERSNATGIDGDQTDNSAPSSGAVYVFTRSGTTWSQQAYIKASNTDAYDGFGHSIALSGDTLTVGARSEDSRLPGNQWDNNGNSVGAVYVFTRSGTTWSQQAYIKATSPSDGAQFGFSVALSGETLAVGAPGDIGKGVAYVFTRTGSTWTQQAFLTSSNADTDDWFGASLALSGDTLAVSAMGEDSNATGIDGNQADNSATNAGAVYVFTRNGTTWSQQFYVKASNTETNDSFGSYITLSGDTLVVGAEDEDSNAAGINGDETDNSAGNSGAVYVFE